MSAKRQIKGMANINALNLIRPSLMASYSKLYSSISLQNESAELNFQKAVCAVEKMWPT